MTVHFSFRLVSTIIPAHTMSPTQVSDTSPSFASGGSSPGLDREIRVPDSSEPDDGSYSLLLSTRVTTAACIDRLKMAGMMNELYDHLESYEETARRYGYLEEALTEEHHRGDLLEQKLSTLREAGIQLRGYVNIALIVCSPPFRSLVSAAKGYEGILAKQEDRKARIHDLEGEFVRIKRSLSEAASDDPDKPRRDQVTARASLEKEYRQRSTLSIKS